MEDDLKVLSKEKAPRKRRPFPTTAFQESFEFAQVIAALGAGQKVRRLTIFEKLGKSPDSGPSRMLIGNANKYGLTKGNRNEDYFELTEKGKTVTNDDLDDRVRLSAKFELSISDIPIYHSLYEKYVTGKLPIHAVISDSLSEHNTDLEKDTRDLIVDTFIVNLKYLGLLRTISGAERIITIDHAIENLPTSGKNKDLTLRDTPTVELVQTISDQKVTTYDNFDNVCFYITPIGEEISEQRKHSDLFLESIVEPAVRSLGLVVKRADHIDKPGTITKQVIEYIFKSKLVIADLSYHNPNVFYELALRHAFRLPTVQIIRKSDRVPFDLNQTRTIIIDTTDIYTLVPKLETYRSEIASQVRQALADADAVDNPITNVFPRLQIRM